MLDYCKSITDYCKECHKTVDHIMSDRPLLIYDSTKLVFLFFCLFNIRDVRSEVRAFVNKHLDNSDIHMCPVLCRNRILNRHNIEMIVQLSMYGLVSTDKKVQK